MNSSMQPLHIATVVLAFIRINGQETMTWPCGQRLVEHKPLIKNAPPTSHWPWHAAIYHQIGDSDRKYQCGGSVITSDLILTAGHCVSCYNKPMKTNQISISLGKLNLSANESSAQSLQVAEIILHPDYSSIDLKDDIAIIRLATNVTFNNYVQPICLRRSNKLEWPDIVGKLGTVIGWGLTESGEISNVLRESFMPVIPTFTCLETNRAFFGFFLTDKNFCAGFRNGTSVCDGDSGSSMTFEENGLFFIRGIVSVSAAIENKTTQKIECDSTHYSVFTDVAEYIPWIDKMTDECEKNVQCNIWEFLFTYLVCDIRLKINLSEEKCKINFSEDSNSSIHWLEINGELDAIPDLSNAITKFENLKFLSFSSTKLKIVRRSKLTAFAMIEKLILNNNAITELAPDTFDDLHELTDLYLDNNSLNLIHRDLLKQLANLKRLQLFDNQIEILSEKVFRYNKKLEKIYVENNKIKIVHRNLFKELDKLEELHLSGNRVETLPADLFRNNQELVVVYLDNNQIEELHSDLLYYLRKLRRLHLHNNQLEILPEDLFRSNQELVEIHLENNKIKTIECDFQSMINLYELNLKGNVCIDEICDARSFCGKSSMSQMQRKIWIKCPNQNEN